MSPFNPKRILIKLSGESLRGDDSSFGIDTAQVTHLAAALQTIQKEGFQLALVVGGGNIFRGIHLKDSGIPRSPADQIGMLATLMNGIALQQTLVSLGCTCKVMSALECPQVAESYNWQKANEYLANGHIVLFVGGTGNPYFTTDSAAALRACEIQADLLIKATKVNGIYTKDPVLFPEASRYTSLTYSQYLAEKLGVMDATSIVLCMNSQLPVFVFNMRMLGKEPLKEILTHSEYGTYIHN